jgi:hypothetical protein
VRGGLDDALDKLARRDELRRRAEGGGIGTPPAVQDLVEAIAAVVGRNPALAVTVGVEGAGDPVLLHFAVQDGIVGVTADNSVASRVAEAAPTSPRHADFDIDAEEAVQEAYPYSPAPAPSPAWAPSAASAFPDAPAPRAAPDAGQATRRISYDDPAFSAYRSGTYADSPFTSHRRSEPSDDATRRIYTQHRRSAEDQQATERLSDHRLADQRVMPTPLPEPVPLKVDTAETELAARRLAALLRDNPTLLRRSTPD